MTSPYVAEALRRSKLPVHVVYDELAELWGVVSIDKNSPDHGHWWGNERSAHDDYSAAIGEFSEEQQS